MDEQKFELIMKRFDNIDKNLDKVKTELNKKVDKENCENDKKNCVLLKKKEFKLGYWKIAIPAIVAMITATVALFVK